MAKDDSPGQPPGALEPDKRTESIDILRGVALLGVLAVNLVMGFRVSIFQQFLPDTGFQSIADGAAAGFVRYGLELKAYALFSFLFGVGLAIQYERLSRGNRPFYWLLRRLAILLCLGLAHLLLIWNGDILTQYAIAGLVVLPLLMAPTWVIAPSLRSAVCGLCQRVPLAVAGDLARRCVDPTPRCGSRPRLSKRRFSADSPVQRA